MWKFRISAIFVVARLVLSDIILQFSKKEGEPVKKRFPMYQRGIEHGRNQRSSLIKRDSVKA